jgi:dolichol-phosphate mannosyltransferase
MISVVIPVLNEEANLGSLYARLKPVLDGFDEPHEILLIDDGSSDRTWERINALAAEDDAVRGLRLSRNFGHQVAISAGLEHAAGDAVIMMDGDLQHPPELLPELVSLWKQGNDVVYTIRNGTQHAGWFKRMSASLYYKLINATGDVEVVPNAADFRLMDRRVVNAVLSMPERARFLRGLVSWVGFKQTGIEFVADAREQGQTKFSLTRMLRFSLDGLTAFSSFPLRISAYVGILAALVCMPYGVWAIYARFVMDITVEGWTSLLVVILFLGSVQLISIGIIGEYLNRIYQEVKGRPLYLTRDEVGFASDAASPVMSQTVRVQPKETVTPRAE